MAFSKEFIAQVKSATDILDLASEYTDMTLAGDQIWQGVCPNPKHDEDTPSLTVWQKHGSWACYGCHHGKKSSEYHNYGSDCIAFLQWIEGISWTQAIIKLAERAGLELEADKNEPLYKKQYALAATFQANLIGEPYVYMRERGLKPSTMKKFMIGFDGDRITFPLIDRLGRHVGFSNRQFVNDTGPKYKNSQNSEIFHKGSYLYGAHLIQNDCDEIRITEGAMDVAVPFQYGVKNIVATLGTSFTEAHVDLIKNLKKTPVFCMDGDPAGLKALKKAADMLAKEGIYSKVLILDDGMDMADLANSLQDETEEYIREKAITYGQMMIQDVMKEYEAQVNELNMKYFPKFNEALEAIQNPNEKRVITDYVYRNTNLRF